MILFVNKWFSRCHCVCAAPDQSDSTTESTCPNVPREIINKTTKEFRFIIIKNASTFVEVSALFNKIQIQIALLVFSPSCVQYMKQNKNIFCGCLFKLGCVCCFLYVSKSKNASLYNLLIYMHTNSHSNQQRDTKTDQQAFFLSLTQSLIWHTMQIYLTCKTF